LVVVPFAALLAIPALRLSGLFLALATLGFGIGVQYLGYTTNIMFSEADEGKVAPRPSFASGDHAYYYLAVVIFVLMALLIVAIDRGRLGRISRGMADSPTSVMTLGLNVNVTRVIVFCISGFMAGLAGVVYGGSEHFITFGDGFFAPLASLILLAVLVIQPFRQPWYAVAGAIPLALIPAYVPGANTTFWLDVAFGVVAMTVAMRGGPEPLPSRVREFIQRIAGGHKVATAPEATLATGPRRVALDDGPGLEVRSLSVRFGGLLAVDNVSLSAPRGRITGLIGPNGAGKTTTFNSCSGLVAPTHGNVLLDGVDISQYGTARRGQLGLGRTFQTMQLCDSLTVAENVALGREAALAGSNVIHQLRDRATDRRSVADSVADALALCGIASLAKANAGSLSTGQRRLVELARCLAGSFSVLLLDEPSSGLDNHETVEFGLTLRRVVDEGNLGILLVEHDMSLVMKVCSHIYVLDFGMLLFEGTPEEVAASAQVRSAYLGEGELASDDGRAAHLAQGAVEG